MNFYIFSSMFRFQKILVILFLLVSYGLKGQDLDLESVFSRVELLYDTNSFSAAKNMVQVGKEKRLAFYYQQKNQICEIRLYPTHPISEIMLNGSADYQILDTLLWTANAYYRFRIRFTDLDQAANLSLLLNIKKNAETKEFVLELPLFAYAPTSVRLSAQETDLFLGEEKSYSLSCERPELIWADNSWQIGNGFEYKISMEGGQLKLYVLALETGTKEGRIPIPLKRPILSKTGQIKNEAPPLYYFFSIKSSRLAFLAADKKDVSLESNIGKGIEIQIDNHRLLQLRKTYRIEDQQEAGGAFVGELFTRSALNNNKVLCWLRPFALHKSTDGYLYLKDNDEPKFITNININEKLQITKVQIMHEGGDWTDNLSVNPGEQVSVRIEGRGLSRAIFGFSEMVKIRQDSSLTTDNMQVWKLNIPIKINIKKISIFADSKNTGYELPVREFQRPRPLDFVTLNYGDKNLTVKQYDKPIMWPKTIKDIVIDFLPETIDSPEKLYGKQHLNIEINIFNPKKDLIEFRKIDNIVVCPGENSVRAFAYGQTECVRASLNLNYYLAHKTHDLADWSTIEITIKHNAAKHGEPGFERKITIVLQKYYTFDIDVSFPAGLLVKRIGQPGFGNLWGISTAILAQFSFYKPDKIQKLRPYRIGAGFIALNAFNFNEANTNRDVGVVVIGSVFPTKTGARFSFPLYCGFGYLLKDQKFFFLLGPGVQVSF